MNKITQILTAIIFAAIAMPVAAQTTVEISYSTSGSGNNRVATVETLNSHKSNGNSGSAAPTKLEEVNGVLTHNGTNSYVGVIVIPETVTISSNDYTVTTLGKGSDGPGTGSQYGAGTFQYSGVTSVTLPKTISSIEQAAFADCPFLMNIFVDDANTKYMDIDGVVYEHNGDWVPHTLVSVPGGKTSVLIPETVTKIAICAMDGCTNIKELTISSTTLNSIGNYAFADMKLDKLTIYSGVVPTVSNTNAFSNCTIAAIYVPKDLVDDYKSQRINNKTNNWYSHRNYIYAIEDNVVVGTFTVAANLTQNYNAKNEVYQIVEIEVTGTAGETFDAGETPTGWTLKHADGTPYAMNLAFTNNNKTVKVTFNELIEKTGMYTLTIPAHCLKTADGTKENDLAQFYWAIEEAEVVTKTVEKIVTIRLNDSENNFSWSYTNGAGNTVTHSETHIVGNTLYIETDEGVWDQPTNTTTITTTVYKSATAEYVREFKNNKWQALYVPFDLVYNKSWAGSFELATVTGVFENVDAENNVVWFYVTAETVTSDTIPANTPCIIRSLQGDNASVVRTIALTSGSRIEAVDAQSFDVTGNRGNTYRFKGQYTAGNLPTNDYTFAMSKGSLCQPNSDAVRLGAYRWYLEINPSDENTTSTFSFGRFGNGENEGTTGLENVKVEIVNDNVYYDLSGRRVENPTKGIYIQNGKKVYVK